MTPNKIIRWGLAGLLLSSVAGLSAPTFAQNSYNTDGLTIFGGVDSEYRLAYNLRNNTTRNTRANYELEVPGDAIGAATSALIVTIPETFSEYRGRIDLEEITVRYGRIDSEGDEIAVDEVLWDDRVFSGARDLSDELDKIEIFLAEDIPADRSFTIEFGKVRNPNRGLVLRTNLQVLARGQELASYVGSWEMLVAYEDRD